MPLRPLPSSAPISDCNISPMMGRRRLSLTCLLDEVIPLPALFATLSKKWMTGAGEDEALKTDVHSSCTAVNLAVEAQSKTGWAPHKLLHTLAVCHAEGSTYLPSSSSTGMVSFPSSTPSSALREENTRRGWVYLGGDGVDPVQLAPNAGQVDPTPLCSQHIIMGDIPDGV